MTTIQRKIAELMELSSFNFFDGEFVVASLEKHADLWLCFYMTHLNSASGEALILRDLAIADPLFHVDTLLILCKSSVEAEKFVAIIDNENEYDPPPDKWNPSTVEIITFGHDRRMWWGVLDRDSERCIIKVWWD